MGSLAKYRRDAGSPFRGAQRGFQFSQAHAGAATEHIALGHFQTQRIETIAIMKREQFLERLSLVGQSWHHREFDARTQELAAANGELERFASMIAASRRPSATQARSSAALPIIRTRWTRGASWMVSARRCSFL